MIRSSFDAPIELADEHQGLVVEQQPGPSAALEVEHSAAAILIGPRSGFVGRSAIEQCHRYGRKCSLHVCHNYYQPRQPAAEEVALKRRIDELYTQYPYYGSRRIAAHLRREGVSVNRKAVQRHVREMGIAGICPGPNLSRRAHGEQVYPYLLRDVRGNYPNHVWGIDVTYIGLRSSWMYLVAVLDWFSRYVVSWELDDTLHLPFVLSAATRALAQARPVVWNSDQGSHFTSPQYRELLLAAGVQISMDGKGRALDNINALAALAVSQV